MQSINACLKLFICVHVSIHDSIIIAFELSMSFYLSSVCKAKCQLESTNRFGTFIIGQIDYGNLSSFLNIVTDSFSLQMLSGY